MNRLETVNQIPGELQFPTHPVSQTTSCMQFTALPASHQNRRTIWSIFINQIRHSLQEEIRDVLSLFICLILFYSILFNFFALFYLTASQQLQIGQNSILHWCLQEFVICCRNQTGCFFVVCFFKQSNIKCNKTHISPINQEHVSSPTILTAIYPIYFNLVLVLVFDGLIFLFFYFLFMSQGQDNIEGKRLMVSINEKRMRG